MQTGSFEGHDVEQLMTFNNSRSLDDLLSPRAVSPKAYSP